MDSNRLRDWLEIVGIFAVVASLIFVGMQMRQTHEIALSQAYQSRVAAAVEWNVAFGSNAAALAAFGKAEAGRQDDTSGDERLALRQVMHGLFLLYDNAHYQNQQGFVSDEFWAMTRNSMRHMMRNPAVREIFLARLATGNVRPAFRAVVEALEDQNGGSGQPAG